MLHQCRLQTFVSSLRNVLIYISSGVSVKDQAVAGVLHQPFAPSEKEGRTVWALVGFGVFGLKQRTSSDPEKSRIMLLTRNHLTPSTTKLAELLR